MKSCVFFYFENYWKLCRVDRNKPESFIKRRILNLLLSKFVAFVRLLYGNQHHLCLFSFRWTFPNTFDTPCWFAKFDARSNFRRVDFELVLRKTEYFYVNTNTLILSIPEMRLIPPSSTLLYFFRRYLFIFSLIDTSRRAIFSAVERSSVKYYRLFSAS